MKEFKVPLRVAGNVWGDNCIFDSDGNWICAMPDEARAAAIVRAVNAHDELVAACQQAFHEHYSSRSGLNDCPARSGGKCECGYEINARLAAAIARAETK